LAVLLAACGARSAGEAGTSPALTHGTAIGEVSDTSAVLWGRCNGGGTLHVRLGDAGPDAAVAVDAARDFTGRIALANLTPDMHYTVSRLVQRRRGERRRGDRRGQRTIRHPAVARGRTPAPHRLERRPGRPETSAATRHAAIRSSR
jgi:hypothetical protein